MITSKINPTDHKSVSAGLFPDEDFREANKGFVKQFANQLRDNKQLRLNSREFMDQTNAIVMSTRFGAWIQSIQRTSLRGFRTIRQEHVVQLLFVQL